MGYFVDIFDIPDVECKPLWLGSQCSRMTGCHEGQVEVKGKVFSRLLQARGVCRDFSFPAFDQKPVATVASESSVSFGNSGHRFLVECRESSPKGFIWKRINRLILERVEVQHSTLACMH